MQPKLLARLAFSLVLALSAFSCVRREPESPGGLHGLRGDEGAFLWSESVDADLQRSRGGAWETIALGDGPWWDPEGLAGDRYRLSQNGALGLPIVPDSVSVDLSSTLEGAILEAGSDRGLGLTWSAPALDPDGPLVVVTLSERADGAVRYLDGACLAQGSPASTCFTEEEADLADGRASFALPSITADSGEPAQVTIEASLQATLDGEEHTLATSTLAQFDLGRRLYWGDLHAHTNLSNDGCELPLEGCAERAGTAGADFFTQAAAVGLDFAAMTDHAEWVTYYPNSLGGTKGIDIFETARSIVAAAEGGPVLPLLGAEWTWVSENETPDGHHWGGHKTLVYHDVDPCDLWRVSFLWPRDHDRRESGWFQGPNPVIADFPGVFWDALETAATTCGAMDVVTFFHHSATERPQMADFTWTGDDDAESGNIPDQRYENLVEVYSEHGSNECLDPTVEGCAFELNPDAGYDGRGSVQQALLMGYRLGFLSGTDAHDGLPGSVDDGPSCTGGMRGSDFDVECEIFGGGISGVLVKGDLTRDALFAALHARNTVGTSGPRDRVEAVVVDADGRVHLPGDLLPTVARPWRLHVWVPEESDLFELQVVAADGIVLETTTAHVLDLEVDSSLAFYLRVRLEGDLERMWLSPFFPDESAGDSQAGNPGFWPGFSHRVQLTTKR
jgi:hypothetical protein